MLTIFVDATMNENVFYTSNRKVTPEGEDDFKFRHTSLSHIVVAEGVILPYKQHVDYKWGIGGVLDCNSNFVNESIHPGFASEGRFRFGGKYLFDENNLNYIDEEVIYCDPIYPQWGHFLVDSVSRLWYLKNKKYKVAFCGFNMKADAISGNFLRFFELLGLCKDDLIDVRVPTKFRKIIIPEMSYVAERYYSKEYCEIFDSIRNAVSRNNKRELFCKKIYFTRTRFNDNNIKYREKGEVDIEKLFALNGFSIISPECLSLDDLINSINNAETIVSLSGTIAHNVLFSKSKAEFIILNKSSHIQQQQYFLNIISGVSCTYVDVFFEPLIKIGIPIDSGRGPFILGVTKYLYNMMEDYGFKITNNKLLLTCLVYARFYWLIKVCARFGLLKLIRKFS